METMKFKGFVGSIEISISDNILHGKLLHINGLITYEAETPSALESAFHDAVEDYLADCEARGINPQKPCSGKFN
ncbi:type II toxin-antitoxin system HicB family antitoxin, partial [Pasteurellaceae bacterium USgator41]